MPGELGKHFAGALLVGLCGFVIRQCFVEPGQRRMLSMWRTAFVLLDGFDGAKHLVARQATGVAVGIPEVVFALNAFFRVLVIIGSFVAAAFDAGL